MNKNNSLSFNSEKNLTEDFIKDCPNYNFVPAILPAVKRIIAIGDIHGDLNLAIRSFKLAKLINDDLEWIAEPKNTVVVQVGDQIDSCRPITNVYDCHDKLQPGDKGDDINVFDFFNKMDNKARIYGGAVYSLLGNHELMNTNGDFKYVSYKNFYEFHYNDGKESYDGANGRTKSFKPGGSVAKMMGCSRNSIIVIGSTMFVHAGLLPVLSDRLNNVNINNNSKLEYLNMVVRKWLLNKLSTDDNFAKSVLINNYDNASPFWTRIYGSIPINTSLESKQCADSVKRAIEVYKIGQLVVGHTPQLFTNKSGINGTCYQSDGSNKLYRIDGGFAHAFKIFEDSHIIQVLEIIDDNKFNILTENTMIMDEEKPKIDINEKYMDDVSKIYSQNRLVGKNRRQLL